VIYTCDHCSIQFKRYDRQRGKKILCSLECRFAAQKKLDDLSWRHFAFIGERLEEIQKVTGIAAILTIRNNFRRLGVYEQWREQRYI
jgi:hypothetical protein